MMRRRQFFNGKRSSILALLLASALSTAPAIAGTYTQIYAFTGGTDGGEPWGQLTPDRSGNLYATNALGGGVCSDEPDSGCGTIFKRDPSGVITTLHIFTGGSGGRSSQSTLTLAGNVLLGSAYGGTSEAGILFKMNKDGSNFTVMHQFSGTDGYLPNGKLLPVATGGFIGITLKGGPGYKDGAGGSGVLFFISPAGQLTVLHNFAGAEDGQFPESILEDSSGNIFGSTARGGGPCSVNPGCGIIFEYNVTSRTYSKLYSLQREGDGSEPVLGGIDANGTLYGASNGGKSPGTLFSFSTQGATHAFTILATLPTQDEPANPPTLVGNGELVGATGSYIYGYHNGSIAELFSYFPDGPRLFPTGQFLVDSNAVIYGTSTEGGIVPCTLLSGMQVSNGCGNLFTFSLY